MRIWNTTFAPLLVAHRGANQEDPENTIEAFRRALDWGADVLELDIHATRDGVFVVSHDPTGERIAGIPRAIGLCDWTEICTWDAGWGFHDAAGTSPFRGMGLRFPRLEEVMAAFPTVPLNVDVKSGNQDQLRRLLDSIHAARAEERVLLTSFSWRRLRSIAQLKYAGAMGLAQMDVARLRFTPEWVNRAVGFYGSRAQIPVRSGPIDLSQPSFIERCHHLGLAVDYWVINDPELATELLKRGADGIVTDDTAAIASVFRQSPKTTAWRARHALAG